MAIKDQDSQAAFSSWLVRCAGLRGGEEKSDPSVFRMGHIISEK